MNIFKDLMENPDLSSVSWFRPTPTSRKGEDDECEDISADTCLKCGRKTKLIFKCDGQFLTCIHCGWIEPYESLNDVEFAPEIRAEIFNPDGDDEHRTNGFSITYARDAGCSGFKNMRTDEVEIIRQICPHCGSKWTKKYGTFKNKYRACQRFHCFACLKNFSERATQITVNNVTYSIQTRLGPNEAGEIIKASMEGFGVRQIHRRLNRHAHTISGILKQVRAVTELFCKCGKPFGVKHSCDHIREHSPQRLQYLKTVSPAKYE